MSSFSGKPGAIGLTAWQEAGDGIAQDTNGRLAQRAAGLTQRSGPRNPAVPGLTGGAPGALGPPHRTTPGACCPVGGGFDARLTQEAPPARPSRAVSVGSSGRRHLGARGRACSGGKPGHPLHATDLPSGAPWPCGLRPGLSMNGTDMRCSTYPLICAVQEYVEYAA